MHIQEARRIVARYAHDPDELGVLYLSRPEREELAKALRITLTKWPVDATVAVWALALVAGWQVVFWGAQALTAGVLTIVGWVS